MRTLLISYDLAKPNQNKHVVAQAIMGLGTRWARPLESTWYVSTDVSEEAIGARLGAVLDVDDGLLVQAVSETGLLANTSLRWFRQRRAPLDIVEGSNVIAFPAAKAGEPAQAELPFAEAC